MPPGILHTLLGQRSITLSHSVNNTVYYRKHKNWSVRKKWNRYLKRASPITRMSSVDPNQRVLSGLTCILLCSCTNAIMIQTTGLFLLNIDNFYNTTTFKAKLTNSLSNKLHTKRTSHTRLQCHAYANYKHTDQPLWSTV